MKPILWSALVLPAIAVCATSFAQDDFVVTASTTLTATRTGTFGSTTFQIPQFDTLDGRRSLQFVTIDSTILQASRVFGQVSHPPFSGNPQTAESRARLRINGQVNASVPGGGLSSDSFSISRGGSVFSTGTTGRPPISAAINLSSSNRSFSQFLPLSTSSYEGDGTWPLSVSWSLNTSFERQEGPNRWQFSNRSTSITVTTEANYTYTIEISAIDADVNNDASVDFFDVANYLNAVEALDPESDITLEGNINDNDIAFFLAAVQLAS